MTAEEFIKYMGHHKFYHFTDTRNLPQIRNHGLLSLKELNSRNIVIPAAGGNQWSHDADKRIGLDGYVHLCLWDQHPMEFRAREQSRIIESRFLKIAPEILHNEGIKFSPDVSNKAGCPIYSLEEAIGKMDFQVVYERTEWREPAIQARIKETKKYELLIPSSVPLGLISGLD